MKILHVIPYFTPKRGGDVNVCYNLSKQLAESGHEVTILTTNFEFDKEYVKSLKNVEVISFNCIANFSLLLYSPEMKKWLGENIKYFDVIHLHTYRSYQNNIVHKYSKKYNVPYVLQAHGSVLPFFAKKRLKKLYDLVWGYRILKDAFKVVALTKTEAEQYKKMSVDENRIGIVPNGINLSEYENLPDDGIFKNKYGIKNNEKIVLYLGRVHKSKGIDLLVDAFFDISKELNDIRLVIIGPNDGYQQYLLERLQKLEIEDKILFTGFVTDEDKIAAFADADVFITPRFSGFPITFLEACACGTPIITTNYGDKLDWIHGKTGYMVQYDKEQLCDAMFKMLSDEELRQRFGGEGRRLVKEKFGWDEIVKQMGRVYGESVQCFNHWE